MKKLSAEYRENTAWFDRQLGVGRSCDIVSRDFSLGGRRARVWVVDGYGKDAVLERMGAFWLSLPAAELTRWERMQEFADRYITFSRWRSPTTRRRSSPTSCWGRPSF